MPEGIEIVVICPGIIIFFLILIELILFAYSTATADSQGKVGSGVYGLYLLIFGSIFAVTGILLYIVTIITCFQYGEDGLICIPILLFLSLIFTLGSIWTFYRANEHLKK